MKGDTEERSVVIRVLVLAGDILFMQLSEDGTAIYGIVYTDIYLIV